MSENVQFDSDDQQAALMKARSAAGFTSRAVLGQSQVPGMATWLLKKGIIKNESNAKGILIAIVIADFVVAALVIYFFVLR